MFVAQFRSRDLEIQITGRSRQECIDKINKDLIWWNESFPLKRYAKKISSRSNLHVFEVPDSKS